LREEGKLITEKKRRKINGRNDDKRENSMT
jgi:hypothetical protein